MNVRIEQTDLLSTGGQRDREVGGDSGLPYPALSARDSNHSDERFRAETVLRFSSAMKLSRQRFSRLGAHDTKRQVNLLDPANRERRSTHLGFDIGTLGACLNRQ